MKIKFILISFFCLIANGLNVYSQQTPPPGAGDKDLRDNNIKTRSIDLERVDRDARKKGNLAAQVAAPAAEDRLAVVYAEIKADFEQVQLSQDVVVKTYQGTGKIDYAQISKAAAEINKSAMRLDSNLFPAPSLEAADSKKDEKKAGEPKKETKTSRSVRDLIIDLDNSIGSFASSVMFQNLRTVDEAVSTKARLDLQKIIELSALLDAESRKMSESGK
ncbi:MAG: hypothetical protein JWN60_753 [Acidobacteria bacterium]|jgi:hypothetical protein|nr:hypothetical protein [Acidobacteriota bacterium]